mgnify:CR=1 FL=1
MTSHSRRAGFTLLEVLIASIVLAIALMGLLSAILYIHTLNQGSRENELALRGASEKMEEVMSQDLDTVVADYDLFAFDVEGLSEQQNDPDARVGLVDIDDTNPDLLQVHIEVLWRGRTGNNAVRLDSMMARRD